MKQNLLMQFFKSSAEKYLQRADPESFILHLLLLDTPNLFNVPSFTAAEDAFSKFLSQYIHENDLENALSRRISTLLVSALAINIIFLLTTMSPYLLLYSF